MHVLKVKGKTPVSMVSSSREPSGQLKMCTLLVNEIHPHPGQQYAIALFGSRAEHEYHEGELLLAALTFLVKQGEKSIYQAVQADELQKISPAQLVNFINIR